jgi:hypothetical protein
VTAEPVVVTMVAVVVVAAAVVVDAADVVDAAVVVDATTDDPSEEHAAAATPKIATPIAPVPTVRMNRLRSRS